MNNFIQKYWIALLVIILILFALCIATMFGVYKQREFDQEITQLKLDYVFCQQICGDQLIVGCNRKTDIIVCDPNIRVQHFPK